MADINEQRSVTTIFTNAGQKLAAQLIANKNTAKFTHGEISTTNLFNESVTDLQVLTSLDNIQQEATLAEVIIMDKSTVRVQLAVDQTKAPNDYQMRTVGLYAKPADGDEILYSVTVMKDPIYVHQDASGSSLGLNLDTIVGQSANVTIEVNPAGAVTNEVLAVTLVDYVKTDDLKKLLPDTLADTAKANHFKGANVFDKTPTDADGNPYITNKDAQAKVDAGVKTAASDAQTKATAAQTAAEKYADSLAQGVQLSSGTDLYALLDGEKSYYANSNATAATMVNSPTTSAFTLTTRTISAGSGSDSKAYKITAMSIKDLTGKQWHAVIATDGSGGQKIDVPWMLDPTDDSKLVHNGDLVKGLTTTILADKTDLDTLQEEGVYASESLHVVNGPIGAPSTWLMVRVRKLDKSNGVQEIFDTKSNRSWHRSWNSSDLWSPWVQSAVDSLSKNLVYNSSYIGNAYGWDFCGGKGYLSVLALSSYNGSPGFGVNISDQSTDTAVMFGASRPKKLVITDVNSADNVYFMKARAKIYSDSVTGSRLIAAIAFLNDAGERVGDLSENYVDTSQKDVWTVLCVENVKLPAGATQVQIQYYSSGSHVHGMITEPMIAVGKDIGQYVPDTIGMADVANYQHVKLTADDGSNEYAWQDATMDLKELIKNLPLGVHTFFAMPNLKSAPALTSGGMFRGLMHMASNMKAGTGYMVDSMTADAWSITCANGTVTFEKLASDAGSKSYTDAQLEAAVKKVLGETVRDNGDGSVTVNGVKMVPADTAHVITVNDAGTAQAANFDADTLTVDQLQVLGFKIMYDTDDYAAWGAAHPNALLIVLHKATS